MGDTRHRDTGDRIVVIGAGIGGLAAALRLAAAGMAVTLVDENAEPGGKMRTVPSAAGPVDAGPTVLTLREVFDGLFAAAGTRLEDHLTLLPQRVLARHWWPDGSTLDLYADPEASAAAIRALAGPGAEDDFRRFRKAAAVLYEAFEAPVIRSRRPSAAGIAAQALRRPAVWPWLIPGRTLAQALASAFRDPRLAQLFGRYATYVGGSPFLSPAVLALVWRAEERGVWAVRGGMQGLARALAAAAEAAGVVLRRQVRAERLVVRGGRVGAVVLAGGEEIACRGAVFNGDPAALARGALGTQAAGAVGTGAILPRSLSAQVWSFAAEARGLPLQLHNVLFATDPRREFGPLAEGRMPEDATLYICAQDRAEGAPPGGPERFEIILNAPPAHETSAAPTRKEYETCLRTTFGRLRRFGLALTPEPGPVALTGPPQFARMFAGSQGSLYGLSPHGTLATFRRPSAQTRLPGLWLCGGGTHPGAGVPMAALSGIHAAEAILARHASMSRSARMAMPGGTSTASRTTDPAPSR